MVPADMVDVGVPGEMEEAMNDFDPVIDTMGGQSYATAGENAMKDLCAAMGVCWHEDMSEYGKPSGAMLCRWCGRMFPGDHVRNPSPTDPAFCWRALQYMLHRDDWNDFYYSNQEEWLFRDPSDKNYYSWLFDPARFIELANEWCREHTEKGE